MDVTERPQRFEPVPDYLDESLRVRGVDRESVLIAASSDLSNSGHFCETWILVTKEKIMAFTGQETEDLMMKKPKKAVLGFVLPRKKPIWTETGYTEFKLADISEIKSENLIATGVLTVRIADVDYAVCTYTSTLIRKFAVLAGLVNKVKNGEELADADFKIDVGRAKCPTCGRYYPNQNRKVCPKCMDKGTIFKRLLTYVSKYKLGVIFLLGMLFILSAIGLLNPYLRGKVLIDQVLNANSTSPYHGKILEFTLVVLGIAIVTMLLTILKGRIGVILSAKIVYDLKVQIFSSMQKLSLRFYNNKQTGSLMTRVNNDAGTIQTFINDIVPMFVIHTVTLVSVTVSIFVFNWKLALIVYAPVPIMFYFLNGVFPKFWKLRWKSFAKTSKMTSMVNDNLTGARVVKAFGREDSETDRFRQVNEEINRNTIIIGNMSTTVFPLFSYIISLGSLAIWGFGGWMIVTGTMELGTLMTFLGYIGMVYGPISYFSHYVDWWSDCISSAQRIFEILDTEPEIVDAPNPVRMPDIRGDISLKNIFFAYEPNKNVLHGVSLDIKAGEMIGLVGHSGAGKSTLTNLITRLYDVNEGGIFIDGVNIKDIAINDLRPHIGMVLQDTYLFDGTLAENIAYARPDAPLEDIIAAAKAANAHDFIMKMNDGYNTVVGTRRINLSGGERQRISIARAILHDPKILILDEATASLDTDTERMIQQALERLVKGRTTIAIAHRLSTLRNADRLAVVEKGKIVEVGTHAELTAMKGAYFKMIQRQQEALKIKGVAE